MRKSVVIGIDEYIPLRKLNGCKNDAERLEKLLSAEKCGFLTKVLVNEQATRANVKKEISWCLSDSDFSVIYFAGHGVRTSVSTFLATYDYSEDDEGIDVNWIQNAVAKLTSPGAACIVIFDCCHSGGADVRNGAKIFDPMGPEDLPIVSGSGRVLLAACTATQFADEAIIDGVTHGKFTNYLCEAISGFAANEQQQVTVHSSYDYIAKQMETCQEQIPVFKGDMEGQLIFASNVVPLGNWRQRPEANLMSPKIATVRAENLLTQILQKTTPKSHDQWQTIGYKEACQAFEPVANWFERRIETQPELKADKEFREKYASCQQIFKSLGSVMPGMEIPQGRVDFQLGSGTFGTVFGIRSKNLNEPVCFKVYHAHDLLDIQKVSRFRRGYAAMKQLDHPKIVKVRELSEIPLGFFMDFIDGANARDFNPGATQEPETILDLLLEVAETLQHAHGRGVIHRDVKPENILIKISPDGNSSAYLTDFDLSWFSSATQVTKLSEGFGSHFYAAPEQINNPNTPIAHRSTVDTYSFGQLCFFFVTGRDPLAFNPESNSKALDQELSRKWTDSGAATEFAQLYKKCTQIAPDSRISDFRQICETLAQIQLTLNSPDAAYDTPTFIEQVRFTLSGDISPQSAINNYCTFRSRSGRTETSIRTFKDAQTSIGIEVTFRPDSIIMEGRTSQEARTKINARIDSALNSYIRQFDTKRSGAKSGAFEITVRIDHLRKERKGVVVAREIIAKVLDQLEHT